MGQGEINNATLPRFICFSTTTSVRATELSAFFLFCSFHTDGAGALRGARSLMVQSKIGHGLTWGALREH